MRQPFTHGLYAAAAASLLALASDAWTTNVPVNQCLAGKIDAAARSFAARTTCYAAAASHPGAPTLASCLAKVVRKLTGGADPARGSFARVEARHPPTSPSPCLSFDDAAAIDDDLSRYAAETGASIGSGPGKCDAAKLRCVGKYVAAAMDCFARAATREGSVDPGCLERAERKLADGNRGCLDRAARLGDCSHAGSQAAELSVAADTFVSLAIGALGTPTGSGCPTRLVISEDADQAGGAWDLGWTGMLHNLPVLTGTTLTLDLACSVGDHCRACSVSGPIANVASGTATIANRRCGNDSRIPCASDAECVAVGGACQFFSGPPRPVSAGGVSFCATRHFTGPVTGTADLESGAIATAADVVWRMHAGDDRDSPCPRCLGDGTPNDGAAGGVCDQGPHGGQACDVNGETPGFADGGSTSLDCPPDPASLAFSLPLHVGSTTATVVQTLGAAHPDCTSLGFTDRKCLCDTCNDAGAALCMTDADCPISGKAPGVCGGRRCLAGAKLGLPCERRDDCLGATCARPGAPTRPHACTDDSSIPGNGSSCDDVPPLGDGEGECPEGPLERYCSNHPQRGCSDDAECDAVPGTCQLRPRPCFPDNGAIGASIIALGAEDTPHASAWSPTFASVFCIPPSDSDAANVILGLPGPGRFSLNTSVAVLP